jgi:hypothetical protein
VDLPSHTVPLAYAATLIQQGPALRAAISAWRAWAPQCALTDDQLDGTAAAIEGGLMQQLAYRGIHLGARGCPVRADDPRAPPDPLTSLCPPLPEARLLSRYFMASADEAFRMLLALGTQRDKARLRSASGPTAGKVFTTDLS